MTQNPSFLGTKSEPELASEPLKHDAVPEAGEHDASPVDIPLGQDDNAMLSVDDDTKEMMQGFAAEALQILDAAADHLLNLRSENPQTRSQSIHWLVRGMYTIKGLSGFLALQNIVALSSALENLTDLMRRVEEQYGADAITTLEQSLDVLRLLALRTATMFQDHSDGIDFNERLMMLDAVTAGVKADVEEARAKKRQAQRQPTFTLPDTLEALKAERALAQQTLPEPALPEPKPTSSSFVLETDTAPPFSPLSPITMPDDLLAGLSLDALAHLLPPDNAAQPSTESLAENGATENDAFFEPLPHIVIPAELSEGLSLEYRPEHQAEYMAVPTTEPLLDAEMLRKYLVEAHEYVARSEECLLRLEQNPDNEVLVGELFGIIHSLKGNSGFMGQHEIEQLATDMETVLDAVRQHAMFLEPSIISVLLGNIDDVRVRVQALGESLGEPVEQPAQNTPPAHTTQVAAENVTKATARAALAPPPQQQASSTKTPAPSAPTSSIAKKDIRVDTAKLDALFNLVGELITVETMVVNSPDVRGLELPGFTRAAGMLNKITRELQEVSMAIRMMPLEGLFNKMKRLVRDLSLRFGKKLTLVIEGAETEMDKTVIEELSDPLMHILRNAIDHGIEPSAEERVRAGKPETATVRLAAQYEGNEILIIIEDDGRGLSREKILRKAQEQGLLKAHHAAALHGSAQERVSDAEVWGYIFEAGFSTAEQVSDISGRGVGMDVVRKNIEKLQGRITVESQLGRGTRFVLRIPLTLAIMEGMTVRVGRGMYALPIVVIREAFRAKAEQITRTMDGVEMVKVREEMIAVVRLHEVYERVDGERDIGKGIVVVVESDVGKVGLLVDEIVGQQQIVVKGLSEYIGSVRGVTGCMILSNGEIGLIIDVDAVVRFSTSHAAGV